MLSMSIIFQKFLKGNKATKCRLFNVQCQPNTHIKGFAGVIFICYHLNEYSWSHITVVFQFKHVGFMEVFRFKQEFYFPNWRNWIINDVWFKEDFRFRQDFCCYQRLPLIKNLLYKAWFVMCGRTSTSCDERSNFAICVRNPFWY